MSIRWSCRSSRAAHAGASLGHAARSLAQGTVPLILVFLPLSGCSLNGPQVKAQYRLGPGPVLVLVDDVSDRVDWPPAKAYLVDDVSAELIQQKAAAKVVPRQTLDGIRQNEADFERRGCREIGELAGAEQVLWLQVQEFLADEQIPDAITAAYFGVTVKVISVAEKEDRSRVRLWPASPEGQLVSVTLSGSDVVRAKTKDAISRELTRKLASDIAKFFYDHRAGTFEAVP